MSRRPPSRLPSRALVSLAATALVFGVRYDAYAYGNHRDKAGEGVLVSHAQGLPDLARGKQAAAAGRLDDAEADLQPLAERGYVEAQIALAKLYAQLGTPERVTQAIAWLRTAHDHSPLDTEVPLGRLLVRQNDDASIAEGEALLASGWDQHRDADALAGLIRVYSEHPQLDTQHRVAALVSKAEQIGTPDVQGAVISWYRSTRRDDGHEQKLVSLCGRWVDQVPACYVDLARAERVANRPGRMQALVTAAAQKYDDGLIDAKTLATMARMLVAPVDAGDDDDSAASGPAVRVSDVNEDEHELSQSATQQQAAAVTQAQCTRVTLTPAPANGATNATTDAAPNPAAVPAQPELANQLLAKLLKGADDAPVLAAGVVTRYPYLLPNADIEASLRQGVDRGVPEATLYLGEWYLSGARTQRDPVQALRYLQQAADQPPTALKAHYELGRLFAEGYLDESRPLLAAQYLMWSARRGYTAADGALARLFVNGRGLCPNLANAYVFARLGARDGSASITMLEQQIAARLPSDARAQADHVYVAERDARPSAYRIPQTMLAEAAAIAAEHGVQIAARDTVDVSAGDDDAASAPQPQPQPTADAAATAQAATALPSAPDVPAAQPLPTPVAAVAAPNAASAEPSTPSASLVDASQPAGADAAPSATTASTLDTITPAPPPPAAPIVLSHQPSSDPALRTLLGRTSAPDERAASPAAAPSQAVPGDAKTLEYIVPVQVPDAAPAADAIPPTGDRS